MEFSKIKPTLPTNLEEFYKCLEQAYNMGKEDTTYKLQCCANCKKNDFGHKCSKWQSGECKDYSCWEIHDSDGVEM